MAKDGEVSYFVLWSSFADAARSRRQDWRPHFDW
jgi:hypothetical protein